MGLGRVRFRIRGPGLVAAAFLLANACATTEIPFDEFSPGYARAPASTLTPVDELTLYIYPSPGIDWTSPSSLFWDSALNVFGRTRRSIGHVSVELNCGGPNPVHLFTGMSQKSHDESIKLIFQEGYGLGLLFHSYPGLLEPEEKLRKELPDRLSSGKLSFVTFQLNSETCQRLNRYATEYRTRGYDRSYGLANRPLHGEGAGCSAFAASFVEVAGLMEHEFKENWSHTIQVPKTLIGGPLTEKPVSVWTLLFRKEWAREGEDRETIFFWNPDRFHDWVKRVWESEGKNPTGRYQLVKKEKAIGLVLDRRSAPTPVTAIWQHEVPFQQAGTVVPIVWGQARGPASGRPVQTVVPVQPEQPTVNAVQ